MSRRMRAHRWPLLALCTLLAWGSAPLQAAPDLYDQALREYRAQEDLRAERERRFLAERDRQQAALADLQARLAEVEAETGRLQQAFDANEVRLAELSEALRTKSGDFGELFGVVRQAAGDFKGLVEQSPISAQYPGRSAWLEGLAQSRTLPSIQDLERLWLELLREMSESGRVVRLQQTVVSAAGTRETWPLVRIGAFQAISGDRYLNYLADTGEFAELSRQPAARYRSLAAGLDAAASGSGPVTMAVDPTRGALLGMLVQTPTLAERIHQGGLVGYLILGLGALGLVVVVWRLLTLGVIAARVRRQMRDPGTPRDDNPLGRVLASYNDHADEDLETLESRLDEAVLRETPQLTRGQNLVKLLAAVAPLMGLLGTVTGMILTFQAITLFGTGDPKLMAGGISQALVTTVEGLVVAIPLLFLHSLLAARSKALIQILDQQSAGLIAQRLEAAR